MRKLRWLAAVMAVGVLIPYCEQLHRSFVADKPASAVAERVAATRHAAAATAMRPSSSPASPTSPNTTRPLSSSTPVAATGSATGAEHHELPGVMSDNWSDGKFAAFTKDEADDMAARCELRWQLPRVAGDAYTTSVRALYAELTGSAGTSLRAMTDELRTQSDDDPIAVHRRLADKRAGRSVEASGSVYERFLQLQLDESERAKRDGDEPGARFTLTGCDPDRALFRSSR